MNRIHGTAGGAHPSLPWRCLLALACCLLMAISCREKEPPVEPFVATVNGEKIPLKDFETALQAEIGHIADPSSVQPAQLNLLKEEVLRTLVTERLLLARARELAITVSDEEVGRRIDEIRGDYDQDAFAATLQAEKVSYDAWKENIKRSLVLEKLIAREVRDKVAVTDEEGRNHLEANRKTYSRGARVRAAQIVVRDPAVARGILKRLKQGADFGTVAREASIAPEAGRGGDLGFFERGTMPDVIERAVFSMKPGQVSPVLQSPYGFHIVKVLEREKGGNTAYSDVRDEVLADLRRRKETEEHDRWLDRLRAGAVIGRGNTAY